MKHSSLNMVILPERIQQKIFYIRSKKVMIDSDLAQLYGVETKVLNQAVRRNRERFPSDFMFQLNERELKIWATRSQFNNLRSQIVTSSWGGKRYYPYVFTEQGVSMLSSVLKSDRAIRVNIQIMRTFIQMREMLTTYKDLREKIEKLEKRYDGQLKTIFEVIKSLLSSNEKPKRSIGFRVSSDE